MHETDVTGPCLVSTPFGLLSSPAVPRTLPLLRRVLLLVAGSLLSSFCFALTIRAGLGLGPLFAVQDGLAGLTGISIGTAGIVMGLMVVALSAGLRSWPGPGTFALPILGGVALNAMLPHLPEIHGTVVRLGVVVVATWLMALGGAIIIRASLGPAALDGVMLGIHRIVGLSLAPIRLGMEAAMLAGGWLIGGSVGVGTILTGLLIGPGLQFWMRIVGDGTPAEVALDQPMVATSELVPAAA